MQKDGLIGREPNPADARSTLVCLLPVGRAAIEKAAPGHVADVRRNFIDLLTPADSTCSPPQRTNPAAPGHELRLPRRRRAFITPISLEGIQPGRRSPSGFEVVELQKSVWRRTGASERDPVPRPATFASVDRPPRTAWFGPKQHESP